MRIKNSAEAERRIVGAPVESVPKTLGMQRPLDTNQATPTLRYKDGRQKPASTNSAARNNARALASVSCHSNSGTESATTPAAA